MSPLIISIHMCTCLFVFPGIGQGLSLDIIPGKYRPGIPRTYCSHSYLYLVLVLVLGVSVLDVLEYLIGENSKYLYLYLYLITST